MWIPTASNRPKSNRLDTNARSFTSSYYAPSGSSAPISNRSGVLLNHSGAGSNQSGPLLNHSGAGSSQSGALLNRSGAVSNQSGAPLSHSGAVSNHSGGINGNVHGSIYTPASRSSSNIVGLPYGVQQAQSHVASVISTANNLSNALSQLSLGNSRAQPRFADNGALGSGLAPNMGHVGKNAGSSSVFVFGENRGSSSASVPSIQASPTASTHGNSYSGSGMPVSQNQFQDGRNFSYMALLTDSNIDDDIDLSEFQQLSGHFPSADDTQGQLDLNLNNFNISQHGPISGIPNEDFSLPLTYEGYVNLDGSTSEYGKSSHPKEHPNDNMTNLMPAQQFFMGKSPGFSSGNSYLSHHPTEHDLAPSTQGMGFSYSTIPSNQDFHFYGPEYQHFQQAQPSFTNRFKHKELKSGSPLGPNDYGLLGLLNNARGGNSSKASLAMGVDPNTLGLDLFSSEPIHQKFASPWSDQPYKEGPKYHIPDCFLVKQPPPLKLSHFNKFKLETLFYVFYSMPKDESQLLAANELHDRGWFYHKEHRLWFTRMKNMAPVSRTNTYEVGSYICFDPNTWKTVRQDNVVLQYEMIEKRPPIPYTA